MDDDRRERARAYRELAIEYHRTADALVASDPNHKLARPFWGMLAHGLELAIKARLRAGALPKTVS